MAKFAVIMPAAGKSERFHDKAYKKPYAPLDNRAVWLHAADKFNKRPDVAQLILVISPEDRPMFEMKFGANVAILGIEVVDGGANRMESVKNGLARVKDEVEYVAIHDAVRPCIAEEWIDKVFAAAEKSGAAILANPVSGTLKRVAGGKVADTVARDGIWEAQTPQVFRKQMLIDAYASHRGDVPTDDAQLIEQCGQDVTVMTGSPLNIKITTKDDLRFAQLALKALPKPNVLGQLHPFAHEEEKWR